MRRQRDNLLLTDDLYEGETVQTLGVEHLHDLCRHAIERCKELVEPLGLRFRILKSQSPLQRREETLWLTEALDHWFTKKWNDKRGAEARKNESPRKKKMQLCMDCHKELRCVECEGLSQKVYRPRIPPSKMR